jgi:cardiolipin synthase
LYDWLGCLGRASLRFWADLRRSGVEVRAFNPPEIGRPLAWIRRNHRKVLVVDGRIAFVSGLCLSSAWLGDPARGVEPWHDTGVSVRGPVVADVVRAFAETWELAGSALPAADVPAAESLAAPVGDVTARVIAGRPGDLSAYRLDQFVAAAARRSLWLTDAYFVATTAYVRALTAAARDGVDVRLLVPRSSDIPALKPLTRAGYRPLIEAGVRVFEWNGSMLHAKTAVADGTWARVGSTNLNLASWHTNWELDVMITSLAFARAMEDMYLADLRHATEVVLDQKLALRGIDQGQPSPGPHRGSASRIAAGAFGLGNTAGAAITAARPLAPAEAKAVASIGGVLFGAAILAILFPVLLVAPFAIFVGGIGVGLMARALRVRSTEARHGGRLDG